ncbi:cation-translocating P-type ATPase [Methylotenera sp.]|uniref:heavy metal translocating P-type ATPase n=1 Tax=Methylotenera sp. TaxID=2051956 RepID=UPI00248A1443|nr:cation-translocating P-type ATPase [Methylotenera sp.]MDI1300105.1 cation-translocating P-type ATPase [Methylotenera sp.]
MLISSPTTDIFNSESNSPNPSWVILDTQDQWQAFSQPAGNDPTHSLVESSLLLDGLRCAACSGTIERGLGELSGVVSARVSMSKKRASVIWSPALTKPSTILSAIQAMGYSANPASHNENQLNATKKSRAAFWRWLVAGFCMMQVMMYASPSYFTKAGDITPDIAILLNWASWILSLPVLVFSSSTFFANAFRDLKHRQISMDLPVALGIGITFIVSSAATFAPHGWWGDKIYFDSLTMFVFFLLSARLIEVKLHSKTLGSMEALVSRIPENIERLNLDGSYTRVLNSQLKVGDIARVHIGEAFPADGKLVLGDTRVDESLLTGESTPIQKNLHDKVVAGSYNLGQTVNIVLETIGESTQYGQIVNLINQAAIEKPRLSQLADRVARPFLLFVILSAVLAAALLWNVDHARALMTAAAVLIVTCPCALSLATPAAMLASASAFVKRGILIRRLQAIESIANIDTVIFDKTGTLTEDHIEVQSISYKQGFTENGVLALAAAVAQHSMHPVSRALVSASQQVGAQESPIILNNIQEVVGAGISATLKANASNADLINAHLKLGSAKFCGVSEPSELSQQVFLADANGWLATFSLHEAVKHNAALAVQQLKDAHLNVELLSGDQAHTVINTAKEIGITQFQAACSPQDKLSRLQTLKQQGKHILMVGDGLNDGPILASAHVSIAMGKGVPLTLAHADYVLLNGDISQIPQLIRHARKTMTIIKQNIAWAIVYNLVCIPLAFFGVLSAWLAGLGMAVSSIIVVLNALRLTTFSETLETKAK